MSVIYFSIFLQKSSSHIFKYIIKSNQDKKSNRSRNLKEKAAPHNRQNQKSYKKISLPNSSSSVSPDKIKISINFSL